MIQLSFLTNARNTRGDKGKLPEPAAELEGELQIPQDTGSRY